MYDTDNTKSLFLASKSYRRHFQSLVRVVQKSCSRQRPEATLRKHGRKAVSRAKQLGWESVEDRFGGTTKPRDEDLYECWCTEYNGQEGALKRAREHDHNDTTEGKNFEGKQ